MNSKWWTEDGGNGHPDWDLITGVKVFESTSRDPSCLASHAPPLPSDAVIATAIADLNLPEAEEDNLVEEIRRRWKGQLGWQAPYAAAQTETFQNVSCLKESKAYGVAMPWIDHWQVFTWHSVFEQGVESNPTGNTKFHKLPNCGKEPPGPPVNWRTDPRPYPTLVRVAFSISLYLTLMAITELLGPNASVIMLCAVGTPTAHTGVWRWHD